MESAYMDQTQLRQQHRRYITYNIGIWFLVLIVGALALALTRQYGNQITDRHQAELDVQAGAEAIAAGNSFQAERTWTRALDTWPGAANLLIDGHHRAITGMPLLLDAIAEIQEQYPDTLSGLYALKLHLLTETSVQDPAALLEAYSLNHDETRQAALWLGRLALDQGKIDAAKALFAQAWPEDSAVAQLEQKELFTNNIAELDKASPTRFATLMHHGVWKQAVAEKRRLAQVESPTAETLAWLGLLDEIGGDTAMALERYEAALTLMPNHRRALQGKHRLEAH